MAKNHFVIILMKFCMVAVYKICMLMLSLYWFPQRDFCGSRSYGLLCSVVWYFVPKVSKKRTAFILRVMS
jgi:hypothetical protein